MRVKRKVGKLVCLSGEGGGEWQQGEARWSSGGERDLGRELSFELRFSCRFELV